jgi:quercetin dioxygenase-like cupin family protein
MNAKAVTSIQGNRFNLLGDAVRVILGSEDTGGAMALIEQRSEPGAGIPLHVHANEDEVFQIFEGQIEFQVGDETFVADAGTVVYAPKQLPHSFRIVGTHPARFQVTAIPGGIEKMFAELAQLSLPPDPQKLLPICERYGIKFLNPPPQQ